MSSLLRLDALYPEMEEATIGQWLVTEGETIAAGHALAELITDKVAYEYRSQQSGVILAILTAEKSVVPVGSTLAVLGQSGEAVENLEELIAENRRLAAEREAALTSLLQVTGVQPAPPPAPLGRAIRATPAARRLARERGVDLSALQGNGPDGMITVDDIP